MELRDKSILDLYINGEPAIDSLKKLDTEIDSLKKQQKELKKELEMQDLDPARRTELINQYREVSDKIKDCTQAKQMLRKEMDMEELSIKELKQLLKDYRKEWESATDPAIREAMKGKIDDVNDRLKELGVNVKSQEGMWSNFKGWVASAFTFTAILEGGRQLIQFFSDSVTGFKEFEKAAQMLSSITGLTGKDLEYLKDEAKNIGPAFAMSGEEMLKAYQVMGSAKPDLLANKELLAATTKEAIILAKASGMDLTEAAKATAQSLNQFGVGADQANRFVNVLAAGAKEGSAEIEDMAMSLKASGTVAASAGLSFEQTNAVLQSMSTIALKGEQSGTMLRNVLLKLQSGADDTNPKIVGLEKALENLGNKNLSTAELAKKFGTENVVAAQHVIAHRAEISTLTEKLTGTSEAYTQAAKNMDTLEERTKATTAQFKNTQVELGERLVPILDKLLSVGGGLISWFNNVVSSSGPLISSIGMIFDIVGSVVSMLGRLITSLTGAKDGSQMVSTYMIALGQVLAVIGAALGGVVLLVQGLIDGFLFLTGKISFEALKQNALNNAEQIKAGLKSAFVDEPEKIKAEAAAKAAALAKSTADSHTTETVKGAKDSAAQQSKIQADHLADKDQKHTAALTTEQQNEAKKNQKVKEEAIAATEETKAKILKLKTEQIDDELTKKLKQLENELNAELAKNSKGKADAVTKAEYEIALRQKYKTDVEKLEADHRAKQLAEDDALSKKILQINSDRIALELSTQLKRLDNELEAELLKNRKSTDDATTKAAKETELRKKHTDDVTALETQYRAKYLEENKTLSGQILDIKTIQIDTELRKKLQQLENELNAELKKNKEGKADADLKAEYETALRTKFKNDVEKLEEDYRAKHLAEERKRLDELKSLEDRQREQLHAAEQQAMKTTLQTKLQDETLNINQRRQLKADLIKLEYDMEMDKIEKIAAKEKQEAQATSDKLMALAKDDAEKKNQIADNLDKQIRAIDTKMDADKRANDAKYQADLKKAELDALAERKENHTKFMDALKGLMTGDYQGFIGFLNNKFKNEKAMNDARLQNWTSKGEQILEVVDMGLQLMQKLEKARLDKQLANIAQEKNSQLASWKEQYNKGLISKDEYEKNVDRINKEANEKEKAEKLKSWKREQNMQIAMAIVHAAMAALKSLATMGFPLGLIGVAGAAAAAAIQIALIKRQQPPNFQSGGILRNGGVPDGPRHGSRYGQSGIALVRRDTQQEIGEMEGGEPIMVLSRNTYANNRRVIDKLLHSSLHRNGAPVFAEKGAMFLEGGYANERPSYNDNNEFNPGGDTYNQSNYQQSLNNSSGSDSFDGGGSSYDGGSGGGGSYDSGGDGGGSYDTSSADTANSMTNEEIAKSQALMENIGKATQRTAIGVERGFLENTESTAIRLDRLSQNMIQSFAQLNDNITRLIGVANENVSVSKDIANTSRITSEKNLSVSVTTINDINNTINVIVDKSAFQ